MVSVAWAERPTGPLSDLYLTSEQTNAVYDWLDDVIARVRREERSLESAVVISQAAAYDAWNAAIDEAQNAVEIHRIRGYACSCGEEINSQTGHHSAVISALRKEQ